jgi:hypothetical protein
MQNMKITEILSRDGTVVLKRFAFDPLKNLIRDLGYIGTILSSFPKQDTPASKAGEECVKQPPAFSSLSILRLPYRADLVHCI